MPRPKRTKVAPSAPAPRVRKAAQAAPKPQAVSQIPNDGFNDLYDVSDPAEELVVEARVVEKRNGRGKAAAAKAVSRATASNTATSGHMESGMSTIRGEGVYATTDMPSEEALLQLDLDSSSPAVEMSRRDRTAGESSLLSIGNFKRRPRQSSVLGRAVARARSSSVESNLAEDMAPASVGRANTSLAIGNFKRRSRQPSILGRNAGRARSSSIGLDIDIGTPAVGSALKLGNFKRRAREPSVLGTAQKPQRVARQFDDEDDDFAPEDQSTPLNLSKSKNQPTSSSSASNSRKRKLSSREVPQSTPIVSPAPSIQSDDIVPATAPSPGDEREEEEDAAVEEDEASLLDEVLLPSIEAHPVTPDPMSETMAPPRSSSTTPESPPLPPLPRNETQQAVSTRPTRARKPLSINQDSPPSSPPSLTHSPNRPIRGTSVRPTARSREQQPPQTSTFSTAQLQALLPRRRRHTTRDVFDMDNSEHEIDVSGLASDDDELTHSTIRAPPRRLRPPPPLKKATASRARQKTTPAGGKVTYSRAAQTSDKENEEIDPNDSLGPLPDTGNESPETSQELEKRVGKELKEAARKFQEVDEWELDFEEITASSSSPRDAR